MITAIRAWGLRLPALSPVRVALAIFVTTMAAGALVGLAMPGIRAELVREDGWIESACAATFLLAAAAAGLAAGRAPARRGWLWLLAGFGLVCGLDELSWGERYFQLAMPSVAGVKLDALHDLLDLALATLPGWLARHPAMAAVAAMAAAVLIAMAVGAWRRWSRAGRPWPGSALGRTPCLLLGWMTLLLTMALAIDAAHIRVLAVSALEEMVELNAALALLLAVRAVYREGRTAHLPGPETEAAAPF